MQKHAFHSYNKAAFTVTIFTNHCVLLGTFSVHSEFYPYMSFTVHIMLIIHTARRSLIEVMTVKTTPNFICFIRDLQLNTIVVFTTKNGEMGPANYLLVCDFLTKVWPTTNYFVNF